LCRVSFLKLRFSSPIYTDACGASYEFAQSHIDILRYCGRSDSGEDVVQLWNNNQGTEVSVVALGNKDCDSTLDDTINLPFTTFVPTMVPAEGASKDDRMEFLHRQLDSLKDQRLLERFVLVGPHARREGGALLPLPGKGGMK
jgi:hypothetical protein